MRSEMMQHGTCRVIHRFSNKVPFDAYVRKIYNRHMKEVTKKDITAAINHLQDCMLEMVDASAEIDKAHLRKIKAQKALSMARDEIRFIF